MERSLTEQQVLNLYLLIHLVFTSNHMKHALLSSQYNRLGTGDIQKIKGYSQLRKEKKNKKQNKTDV